MFPFFIWNGVDSREMGVVTSTPPMILPAERVEALTLPGRPGHVTRTEGAGIYESYVKPVQIACRPGADFRAISAWLRGSGELIFSSEPDRIYYARIIQQASADRVWDGVYQGQVQFHCQPLKGQVPTEPPITAALEVEAGEDPDTELRLYNPGDVASRPVLTVCGAGDVILQLDGEDALEIAFPDEDAPTVTVDTDAQMAATAAGESYASRISGSYRALWLPKLESVITWTGDLTALSVAPRWRWL